MDHLTLIRDIGRGNYGRISLVQDNRDGRTYALKRIPLAGKSEKQRAAAENEVRAMAQLSHPNIVGLRSAWISGDTLHILMEYVDGMDLEKLLVQYLNAKKMLSEEQILDIWVPALLAVRHIHSKKILHRDVKSANILVTRQGDVRICDLGFAKQLATTTGLTSTWICTPYYSCPSLCAKQPYNNKSDVWALGVVLYEMCNLQKPFEAMNLPDLKKRVLNDPPQPWVAEHISMELRQLVAAIFTKEAAARPSIDQLLQAPVIRRHLEKMSARMAERRDAASKRGDEIRKANARGEGESPTKASATLQSPVRQQQQQAPAVPAVQVAPSPDGGNGASSAAKAGISKAELANLFKNRTASAQLTAQAQAAMASHTSSINSVGAGGVGVGGGAGVRELVNTDAKVTDVASQVTSRADKQTLGSLASAVDEAQSCERLRSDVDALLRSPPPAAEEVFEAIGAAETADEERLRREMGDSLFVRAVELLLTLSVARDATARGKIEAELLAMLGDKFSHLLPELDRVSMQFGLD